MNTLETMRVETAANTNDGARATAPRASSSSPNPAHIDARWREIQSVFVDDPRGAVQQADAIIREELHALVNRLSAEQARLAERWEVEETSTEDLRQCLTRYREIARRLRATGI